MLDALQAGQTSAFVRLGQVLFTGSLANFAWLMEQTCVHFGGLRSPSKSVSPCQGHRVTMPTHGSGWQDLWPSCCRCMYCGAPLADPFDHSTARIGCELHDLWQQLYTYCCHRSNRISLVAYGAFSQQAPATGGRRMLHTTCVRQKLCSRRTP